LAALGAPGADTVLVDVRRDRGAASAVLQDAKRPPAGAASQRTAADGLVGDAHRRCDDDGAVNAQRRAWIDIHCRSRSSSVFQAAKLLAGRNRPEKQRVGGVSGIAD